MSIMASFRVQKSQQVEKPMEPYYDAHPLTVFVLVLAAMGIPVLAFIMATRPKTDLALEEPQEGVRGKVQKIEGHAAAAAAAAPAHLPVLSPRELHAGVYAAIWLHWVAVAMTLLLHVPLTGSRSLVVPLAWGLAVVLPMASEVSILGRRLPRILPANLGRHFLVRIQVLRLVGACLAVEAYRGHVSPVVAYPAAIGDILVGLYAVWILVSRWGPEWGTFAPVPDAHFHRLILLGLVDFSVALVLGALTSPGPLEMIVHESKLLVWPTGIVCVAIAPFCLQAHVLALMEMRDGHKDKGE